MLRLFRKFRIALFSPTRSYKYALYAIGEIALVVIGILIALQINNWNEWRKDRQKELVVLNDLKKNIERNCELFEEGIDRIEILNASSELILQLFTEEMPYHDSLSTHFFLGLLRGQMYGLASYDGYESLKNAGFDILESDDLKDHVLYLFEVVYRRTDAWRAYANDYISSDNSVWNKHFIHHGDKLEPIDHKAFIKSTEIYSLAQNVKVIRLAYGRWLEESLTESKKVLRLIDEAIDRNSL